MGSTVLTQTIKAPGLLFLPSEEWEHLAEMASSKRQQHFRRFGYPTMTIAGEKFQYYLATVNGICYKCLKGSRPIEAMEEL